MIKYKCDYDLVKGHLTDSGYDLKTTRVVNMIVGERKKIPTGLFLELPHDIEAVVRPKSSLSSKGIDVSIGTIDSDYRGEVAVIVTNNSGKNIGFEKMQKIAQIVFQKKTDVLLGRVSEIDTNTSRGKGGFGSTGRF